LRYRIFILIFSVSSSVLAQRGLYLGIHGGLSIPISANEHIEMNSYSIGASGEFRPSRRFSIGSEIHYLFGLKSVVVPILTGIAVGDKIRPGFSWGLVPIFRIHPNTLNNSFQMSAKVAVSLDIRVRQRYYVTAMVNCYYLKYKFRCGEAPFGGVCSSLDPLPFITIGIKHRL
jgi:hypothetical protein